MKLGRTGNYVTPEARSVSKLGQTEKKYVGKILDQGENILGNSINKGQGSNYV